MENITIPQRTCGTCTECCKGWLWGQTYDKIFHSGRPCHFLSSGGCTIYEDRPQSPCRNYECAWLTDTNFPEWFKPEQSKVLLTKRQWGDGLENTFIEVGECGQKIDSDILNWIIVDCLSKNRCYRVQVNGWWNAYGTPDFVKWIKDTSYV